MREVSNEFKRTGELLDMIGSRADEILQILDEAKKRDVKQFYAEIADEMCRTRCYVPKLFGWNGKTIKGMEQFCKDCPLVRGYEKCM